jgi:hypothetical protein
VGESLCDTRDERVRVREIRWDRERERERGVMKREESVGGNKRERVSEWGELMRGG